MHHLQQHSCLERLNIWNTIYSYRLNLNQNHHWDELQFCFWGETDQYTPLMNLFFSSIKAHQLLFIIVIFDLNWEFFLLLFVSNSHNMGACPNQSRLTLKTLNYI